MKIEDLQQGKKYWKSRTSTNGRTKKKTVTGIPVFILQVDLKERKILVSINGSPGKWIPAGAINQLKETDPSQPKSI